MLPTFIYILCNYSDICFINHSPPSFLTSPFSIISSSFSINLPKFRPVFARSSFNSFSRFASLPLNYLLLLTEVESILTKLSYFVAFFAVLFTLYPAGSTFCEGSSDCSSNYSSISISERCSDFPEV